MRLLFSILFLLAVSLGRATTYYVSPTGDSGNTGLSTNSPWTLSHAQSQVVPGNTIVFMSGTYPTTTLGTPRITYQSLTKWGAIFSSTSGSDPVVSIYPSTTTNCVLDGFEIKGGTGGSGVYTVANNITVQNCWIHNNGTSQFHYGFEGHDLTGITNQYNLIESNGVTASDHGIYCNGTNVVIRGNVLRYNSGAGAQVYRMSSQNSNEWTHNVHIYDNLMYGNTLNAMTMGSQSGSNYNIFNNTFIQANGNPVLYINDSSVGNFGGQDAVAACTNNIFVGSTIVAGHNPLFVGSNNYTNATVGGAGFVNSGNGLYWLASGSGARGVANTSVIPPMDFWGNAQTSVADAGAFQYNTGLAADTRTLDPSPAAGANYWEPSTPAAGNTNYVYVRDGGGTGSGASWSDSREELPSPMVRGKTYWLADGTYAAQSGINISGAAMITVKKATVANHGTYEGWLDSYGDGQAIFNSGFEFVGETDSFTFDGESAHTNYGIRVNVPYQAGGGTSYAAFELHNTSAAATSMSNYTFRYVEMVSGGENVPAPGFQWGEGSSRGVRCWPLGYGETYDNFTISHCSIRGCVDCLYIVSCTGLLVEYTEMSWSSSSYAGNHPNIAWLANIDDAIWRYNRMHDYTSIGIGLDRGGDNWQIYGNVAYNGMPSGYPNFIQFYENPPANYSNFKCYNNTIANLDLGFRWLGNCSGIVATNNLFFSLWRGNNWNGQPHDYNWYNKTDDDGEAHGIAAGTAANPFNDYPNRDFHINNDESGSSPMDHGLALSSTYNTDIDGNLRGFGVGWDIGAYEFTIAAPDTNAPTLISAEIGGPGTYLRANFSEGIGWGTNGPGGWVLGMSGGTPLVLTYLTGSNTTSLVYELSRRVLASETVTNGLTYTQPGEGLRDSATNYFAGTNSFPVANNAGTEKATAPSATPAGGSFYFDQSVAFVTNGVPGGLIFYTTDGSNPTTNDSLYTTPIALTGPSVTMLQAFTVADGYTSSDILTNTYEIGLWYASPPDWESVNVPTNSGVFQISFDSVLTNSTQPDCVIAFANQAATLYPDNAILFRFNDVGYLDVYSNNTYTAVNQVTNLVGVVYSFVVDVDTGNHVYSATVSTNGSDPITIATDYPFREGQTTITNLSWINMRTWWGSAVISNLTFGADTTAPMLTGALMATNGRDISIYFSEPVTVGASGWNYGWGPVVLESNVYIPPETGDWQLSYQSGGGSDTITVWPRRRLRAEDGAISCTYTQNGSGIMDLAGNLLATTNDFVITNTSIYQPYKLRKTNEAAIINAINISISP